MYNLIQITDIFDGNFSCGDFAVQEILNLDVFSYFLTFSSA